MARFRLRFLIAWVLMPVGAAGLAPIRTGALTLNPPVCGVLAGGGTFQDRSPVAEVGAAGIITCYSRQAADGAHGPGNQYVATSSNGASCTARFELDVTFHRDPAWGWTAAWTMPTAQGDQFVSRPIGFGDGGRGTDRLQLSDFDLGTYLVYVSTEITNGISVNGACVAADPAGWSYVNPNQGQLNGIPYTLVRYRIPAACFSCPGFAPAWVDGAVAAFRARVSLGRIVSMPSELAVVRFPYRVSLAGASLPPGSRWTQAVGGGWDRFGRRLVYTFVLDITPRSLVWDFGDGTPAEPGGPAGPATPHRFRVASAAGYEITATAFYQVRLSVVYIDGYGMHSADITPPGLDFSLTVRRTQPVYQLEAVPLSA